jgi:hypothetical protein
VYRSWRQKQCSSESTIEASEKTHLTKSGKYGILVHERILSMDWWTELSGPFIVRIL